MWRRVNVPARLNLLSEGKFKVGNKHYMFMLEGAKNPDPINGFFNEYLDQRLNKHRKVFEALASKMVIEQTDEQMSGLGFSSTQRNNVVVKVIGNTERLMKITF